MSSSTLYGLVVEGKQKSVPLQSVSVTGHIKGYVVALETTFNYINSSTDPLEVVFRFPIDDGMAVVGLEAKIAGRTIRGVIKEKEEAHATYDDAISSGLTAALGEEKTGDIFSLALGNLPPQGEAQLILKLVGELPLEGESVRFSLPTVLKPRYTPVGSTNPLAPLATSSDSQTGTAPAVSHFSLQVSNSNGVSTVTSPTHDINTTTNDGAVNVTLKEQGPLVKDLIILINYNELHIPHATVEEGAKGTNQLLASPVVMLDFFPKFESTQAACEFAFVVDRSGSMRGSYINSARETLILFLKSIPPGCYFNIIGFGSRYEHLFPESIPYNQTNLDIAMAHAEKMDANLGGTELLEPLKFVFDQKLLAGLPRQVFVLTDGSVSNTQSCIDLTKRNAHVARVFTFGIGSGASSALVNGLAKAGNGNAEFIKEGERMQSKVISTLKKALQPSVTDVELNFSVPHGVSVLQAPNKIPPIFNSNKLVMYGVLNGVKNSGQFSAKLSGKILGQAIEHVIEFEVGNDSIVSVPVIHQLAAKSLIKDWESKDSKKKDVIKMSIESSVVSCYTAYVAVDEEQDKPIEGAMKIYDLTASEHKSYLSAGVFMAVDCRSAGGMLHIKKKVKKKKMCAKTTDYDDSFKESAPLHEMSVSRGIHFGPSGGKVAPPTDGLSKLIALQSAEGYWLLDQHLASLIGRSVDELKGSIPAGCSDIVWGTVLALALLMKQFSSQQDEWELLANKAEFWLGSQQLPSTIESLKAMATNCI